MKHIVNLTGILVIAGGLSVIAVLAETRLLYETISGLPEGAGTLEEWVDDFGRWAIIGLAVALLTALFWYVLGEWLLHVERPKDSDRRPIWLALAVFAVLGAMVPPLFVIVGPAQGAWLAYTLLFVNAFLCYYLSTALFSPSAYKYTPIGATIVRSIRERAA